MDDSQMDEVQSLPAEVTLLRAHADERRDGMSRRHLLRAAPAVALGGALAAVAGASPATASAGDPVLQGDDNTYAGTTSLTGGDATHPALSVSGGASADRVSVGINAVPGGDTICLVAPNPTYVAEPVYPTDPAMVVYGHVVGGGYRNKGLTPALHVEGLGPATALSVNIDDGTSEPGGPIGDTTLYYPGTGISVTSSRSTAIDVQVTESTTTNDGVTIEYAGTSRALYAISSSATNINGTVTGVNKGHGIGVWGEQQNNTVSGIGVVGLAGSLGRGGQFQGGAAALRLVPATASTHPTTGKVGDVFVDSSARIWFCTHASSGSTAATWRQLAFV